MKKGPHSLGRGPFEDGIGRVGLHHAAHAAHPAHVRRRHRHCRLVVGLFGDHGFGGDQKPGDRSRVLQRGAHDLDRIDDARLDSAIFAEQDGIIGFHVERRDGAVLAANARTDGDYFEPAF